MQVTNIEQDFDQIVFSSSKNSGSFSLSDNPEFYQIVSQNIYTKPNYAFLREIICNAHDAHIDANKEDIPISIGIQNIIEDDKIYTNVIITDYGKGIPHDQVGDVYCTLGGSLKRLNSKATGGMGLGSKSPYAIVDNFNIINKHDGEEVGYLMIRSDPKQGGRPSFTELYRKPTTETGITVTVKIDSDKYKQYQTYVDWIVFSGGIKAYVNNVLNECVDYKQPNMGFVYVDIPQRLLYPFADDNVPNRGDVCIKIGAVLYPIPSEYVPTFISNRLVNNNVPLKGAYKGMVVILGEPDSVTLPPSRESLSFSSKTIETLNSLKTKIEGQQNIFNHVTEQYIKAAKDLCIKEGKFAKHVYFSENSIKVSAPRHYPMSRFAYQYLIISRHDGIFTDRETSYIVREIGKKAKKGDYHRLAYRLAYESKLDVMDKTPKSMIKFIDRTLMPLLNEFSERFPYLGFPPRLNIGQIYRMDLIELLNYVPNSIQLNNSDKHMPHVGNYFTIPKNRISSYIRDRLLYLDNKVLKYLEDLSTPQILDYKHRKPKPKQFTDYKIKPKVHKYVIDKASNLLSNRLDMSFICKLFSGDVDPTPLPPTRCAAAIKRGSKGVNFENFVECLVELSNSGNQKARQLLILLYNEEVSNSIPEEVKFILGINRPKLFTYHPLADRTFGAITNPVSVAWFKEQGIWDENDFKYSKVGINDFFLNALSIMD